MADLITLMTQIRYSLIPLYLYPYSVKPPSPPPFFLFFLLYFHVSTDSRQWLYKKRCHLHPTRPTFPFCLPFTWPYAPPSLAVPFLAARVPPPMVRTLPPPHPPLLCRALPPRNDLIFHRPFRRGCLALSGSAFSAHRDRQPARDVSVMAWCMALTVEVSLVSRLSFPSRRYMIGVLCCSVAMLLFFSSSFTFVNYILLHFFFLLHYSSFALEICIVAYCLYYFIFRSFRTT